ncbi:MAG: response regulator [Crocinitomix sp.]|nr:response regulator [Crocinitomix sp.]
MIQIILADDHHVFREGIASFFDEAAKYKIAGHAANGLEVIDLLKENVADVVIMDISMPELDGIATAEIIKKDYPNVKIIMLTMHETQNYIRKLLEVGVDGYLLKTTSKGELYEAIDKVLAGNKFYGGDVQQIFMNSFNSDKVVTEIKLTRREKEILELICNELNTNEIAEKLFISAYTVETHRKNLLSKTGSKNVAGLVRFALENKFT